MSKYLHSNLNALARSSTLAINEHSDYLEKQGKHVYRFGLGQSPFPVPKKVVDSLKENSSRKNYLSVDGLPELRTAVANYHQKIDNVNIQSDQVLIGPGSKELMFCLQLVLKGYTILPTPCWVSYAPQAKILNRKIIFIQTKYEDSWQLLPEQLTESIKNFSDKLKLLILTYPGNPHGCTYEVEVLKQLAKVCRKNKIIILSDEIYGRIHHQGKHTSIARYYPEGTIISSGLSKWCAAGGWRLGHFSFPKELKYLQNAMTSVASETYSCVTTPIQYAATTAYEDDTIDDYLFHCRRILETIGQYCASSLIDAGIKVRIPKGAFYIFPDFKPFEDVLNKKDIHDSNTLCKQLLQDASVALLPGSAFAQNAKELNARLAYVNFDGAEALKKSIDLSKTSTLKMEYFGETVSEVIIGIEEIINWIKR